ncbi:MAG: MerR family transcriptional regulator [Myxococcaceae bacterium]
MMTAHAERTYRTRAAAEKAGLSATLLRAWERRYGVIQPRRVGRGYRAYTEADVRLLRSLRNLTHKGVPIGEAVRQVVLPGTPARDTTPDARLARWAAELETAAMRCDQRRAELVLDSALSALSAVRVAFDIISPALRRIGDSWAAGDVSIGGEHLVTQAVRTRLLGAMRNTAMAAPRFRRGEVVCACLPGEQHDVGLIAAALRFQYHGYRVTNFGPDTPAADIGALVRRLRPRFVALAAVASPDHKTLQRSLGQVLRALPARTQVWVGGAAASRYKEACEASPDVRVLDDEAWSQAFGG